MTFSNDMIPNIARINTYVSLFQAHSSIEKAAVLNGVQYRSIESNKELRMTGKALEKEILKDLANGRVPFIVYDLNSPIKEILSFLSVLLKRFLFFVRYDNKLRF